MARRDELRSLPRSAPSLQGRKRWLICGEGETERDYFKEYKSWLDEQFSSLRLDDPKRGAICSLEVMPSTTRTQALQVLQRAMERRDQAREAKEPFDEVWCVVDNDKAQAQKALRDKARREDVRLAVSTPCFELWLILHCEESPGALDTPKMRAAWSKLVNGHKPKRIDETRFRSVLLPELEKAETQAERLAKIAPEEYRNPTTDAHLLTRGCRPP